MRSEPSGNHRRRTPARIGASERSVSVPRTGLPTRTQSWATIAQEGRSLMLETLRTLLREDAAEDLAEYGIGLAVVVVAAITAAC